MASLKYGCITPRVDTKEYPVAASQYFRHDGVNAVRIVAGHVTLALTADTDLKGIVIVPAGRGAGTSDDYWLSSATAGSDKVQVILATDPSANYMLPADATVTEAMKDDACDLISVNDGTATQVDVGTSSTDVFLIQDLGANYGGGATDVVVKINPLKIQADT